MSKFIYGLNTSNRLNELEDLQESLSNLGLDIEDVNIIRNINIDVNTGGVTRDDLKALSGLDFDVKREFVKYRTSTSRYADFLDTIPPIRLPQPNNLKLNSRLGAGSIKYNYLDFSDSQIKTADISTSRISSWSSFDDPVTDTSPIKYGGDLEVIGPDSPIRATDISILNEPIATKYESEVPTHYLYLNIDGNLYQFYAMKGIPVEFNAFFKNASFSIRVDIETNDPNPSWEIENTDENVLYDNYENVSQDQEILFFDARAKRRKLRYYYNPSKITRISMNNMNIEEFPSSIMENLNRVDFALNNLLEIPDFSNIAPNLTYLNVNGNNLSRSNLDVQQQLNRLPNTIEELYINGCFTDNIPIDLTSYTNLRRLSQNSRNTRRNRRVMRYNQESPAVSSSSIISYTITNQRYSMLSATIAIADNLETLNIGNNNIIELDQAVDASTFEIDEVNGDTNLKIKSDKLRSFRSRSNSHNIVDVSGKTDLVTYSHGYSRNLNGDSDISGKFGGCTNLEGLSLYNTDATGDISNNFSNLPALERLDLRGTRLGGTIESNSFTGSNNLRTILIRGGSFDTNDFIQNDSLYELNNLRILYIYNNQNIGGSLPDFSDNVNLRSILIQNTSMSGSIPSFGPNENLSNLRLRFNQFSGYMPAFSSSAFRTIDITGNNLTSDSDNVFPVLNCPNLRILRLSNNNFNSQISSFENCISLRQLDLSNNNFSSYVSGSLKDNLSINSVNISSNNLPLGSIKDIISDLYKNWEQNNRGNVFVNIRGNNYNESDLNSDETINSRIELLRLQGWIILT